MLKLDLWKLLLDLKSVSSDILRYIFEPAEWIRYILTRRASAIHGLPINLRYIYKRVSSQVYWMFLSSTRSSLHSGAPGTERAAASARHRFYFGYYSLTTLRFITFTLNSEKLSNCVILHYIVLILFCLYATDSHFVTDPGRLQIYRRPQL